MPGPYTAFTYGDPAAVTQWPNNPHITAQTITAVFGMALGQSGAPVPVGYQLQSGTVGTVYSESVNVTGGVAPYTYSIGGTIPPGLSFNTSTLLITGTPTTAGTYVFSITVTDTNSDTGTESFSIVISSPTTGGNYSYVA